jgi:HD-like signal output (HDOD) protein
MDHHIAQKRNAFQGFFQEHSPSFLEAERHVVGFDHTEIAYELCHKWKLPTNHIDAMRHHHSPEEANGNELVHIVHLANYMSKQSGLGCGPAFDEEELYPGSLDHLALKEEDIQEMSAEVLSAVDEISESLNTR